jgi:dynein heavy chain
MWAIGGSVGGGQDDEKDQAAFSSLWRSIAKVKFPEGGLTFDYMYDVSKNSWVNWNTLIPEYKPVSLEETTFSSIYVSTLHTTRLTYLLDLHVSRFKPVLFIGSAGTGKTAVMRNYLSTCSTEKVDFRIMNFNSFTNSESLQASIESMVVKKSGKTFGSASNKTLIYYIDDMNMPSVDKYGTQSPIALLQYVNDYASVFNRELLEERKFLQDILFMGSLNPKSGSFIIDLRLQRHFTVFTMFTPGQDTIKTIYGNILGGHVCEW